MIMNTLKMSSKLPYYRMAGYTATILLHSINSFVMVGRIDPAETDPNLQLFALFMTRFITCWTFASQVIHAALGLSCDLLTLQAKDQKQSSKLKTLKNLKDMMFASIVVPYSLMVPTCFWPIFIYNRELILPTFTTKVVDAISNHVIHTAIVPIVLWEMVFQPRRMPKSHGLNLTVTSLYSAVYIYVLLDTYFENGHFPYPILTILYGSPYFYIFLAYCLSWLPVYYGLQWKLTSLLWSDSQKKER